MGGDNMLLLACMAVCVLCAELLGIISKVVVGDIYGVVMKLSRGLPAGAQPDGGRDEVVARGKNDGLLMNGDISAACKYTAPPRETWT
jgi:hypothetical protein